MVCAVAAAKTSRSGEAHPASATGEAGRSPWTGTCPIAQPTIHPTASLARCTTIIVTVYPPQLPNCPSRTHGLALLPRSGSAASKAVDQLACSRAERVHRGTTLAARPVQTPYEWRVRAVNQADGC